MLSINFSTQTSFRQERVREIYLSLLLNHHSGFVCLMYPWVSVMQPFPYSMMVYILLTQIDLSTSLNQGWYLIKKHFTHSVYYLKFTFWNMEYLLTAFVYLPLFLLHIANKEYKFKDFQKSSCLLLHITIVFSVFFQANTFTTNLEGWNNFRLGRYLEIFSCYFAILLTDISHISATEWKNI